LHFFIEAGNQTINGFLRIFPECNGHTVSPPLQACARSLAVLNGCVKAA
jgi:hypothetical protein